MKKLCLFVCYLVLIVVILSGCGAKSDKDVIKHNYTLKAENDQWSGEYKVDATEVFETIDGTLTYDSKVNNLLIVTYKGELSELSDVKHLVITYEYKGQRGRQEEFYDREQPISSREFKFASSGLIPAETDIICVDINIDGVTESLELKTDTIQ